MKTILIAGGCGFIGSNLCAYLIQNNNKVICVDNFYTGNINNVNAIMNHENFILIQHDIIEPIFIEQDIDEIYHLACPASPPKYQEDPIYTCKINFIGTMNLLGLAKEKNAKILLSSTSEIYGEPKISPQPEWIGAISMLGKTSMGKLANLCARSHRNHSNMPVGIYVSLYANSELEAWYPALEQLKCIGESRCVGRKPVVPLSESNYMECSQRPRESEESFWIPGNAQLYNGMISPYALNEINGIVLYTATYQVQKMHCTLNHLARRWIRAFTHDADAREVPFLCVFNDESNHELRYRVLPSVDDSHNNKTTFLSSSASLSSRIRNIMALAP